MPDGIAFMKEDFETHYQQLDTIIYVDNPLEPEKGGFLKAFTDNYQAIEFRAKYRENDGPKLFDLGIKQEIPKLNLDNGQHVKYTCSNYSHIMGDTEYLDAINADLRVIDYHQAKQLGLQFKDEVKLIKFAANLISNDSRIAESVTKNGFLVSIDELQDKSFMDSLNKIASQKIQNESSLPIFNDEKYKKQFDRVEQLLNHFGIELNHSFIIDKDPNADQPLNSCHFERISASHANLYSSIPARNLELDESNRLPYSTIRMPKPISFRSEDYYLRACAHIIGECLVNTSIKRFDAIADNVQPFVKLNKNYMASLNQGFDLMAKDIAGTMIAAQLGVPVVQNDLKRFCVNKIETDPNGRNYKKDQLGLERTFAFAARIACYVRDLDLSKDQSVMPINKGLWDNWKADHTNFAKQMNSPSLNEIAKSYEQIISRDNIIQAINNHINNKSHQLNKHIDHIKESTDANKTFSLAAFDLKPMTLQELKALNANKSKKRER